ARDHLLMTAMAQRDIPVLRALADATFVDDPTNLVGWLAQTQGMKVKMAAPNLGDADANAMDAAAAFAEVGRYAEAESLLNTICGKDTNNRLVLYWMAWLAERQDRPDQAEKLRARAAAATTEGVYLSNPLAIAPLREAIKLNPDDARAHADLGNMLAGLSRLGDGVQLWRQAVKIDPKQAVAWRNIGLYEWKFDEDLDAAAKAYDAAIKANPADQTYWRDLAQVMAADGLTSEALHMLKTMPTNGVDKRGDILLTMVRCDLELGLYDDAIQIMDSNWFTVGEFQTDSHELFVRALVARGRQSMDAGNYEAARADFARALTYPDNLGIGRRSQPGEAQQDYWLGRALEKLGRNQEAQEAWRAGAKMTGEKGRNNYRGQCRAALDANQKKNGVLTAQK
ncbi:tetratricopeptide repeat protein, partial [bacterium]|nr:tetratricopeptide repeat protein [bacterium]